MSKELTPLKTFELLCRYCVEEINILRHKQIVEDYFYNEKYEVSITDKKTLEKGLTANIKKALKAFEIIKEKEVAIFVINDTSSFDEYNARLLTKGTNQELTQEEYDLLKKVLL
jgi:hypothetical protein